MIAEYIKEGWKLFDEGPYNPNPENIFSYGGVKLPKRMGALALKHVEIPGDFVEIGAYLGETTIELCKAAQKAKKKVIVIDPWEIGTQNCNGGEYEQFLANTASYKSVLEVHRMSSLDAAAAFLLKDRPIAMAFVDGLHTFEGATNDIAITQHCIGAVVVDDYTWNDGVRRVCDNYRARIMLKDPRFREVYFIRE